MLHNTKIYIGLGSLGLFLVVFFFWESITSLVSNLRFEPNENVSHKMQKEESKEEAINFDKEEDKKFSFKDIEVFQDDLSVPWDMVKLSEGVWLISERSGNLFLVENGERRLLENFQNTRQSGEGGLLGLVLHPNFQENNWLYIYQTQERSGEGTVNRVLRYRYDEGELRDEMLIIDDIPGAIYHDGGRMIFGADGYLYIATGDATDPDLAQDTNSLAGKILRLTDEGEVPDENPFGNAVYSYGHRNPQGFAWDDKGNLWSTEHGRSGALSGFDELNKIILGGNYGWPEIEGDETREGMIAPVLHSGADTTWAPGGLSFVKGVFVWGGLRGQTLYQASVDGDEIRMLSRDLQGEYGRLRTTVWDEEEEILYIMTSNDDGRNPDGRSADVILKMEF
jgi:glucose/arabinose dehydrogenase